MSASETLFSVEPKIVYQKLQVGPTFGLDESGMFANSSIWMLISDDLYLLGMLNSVLGWFLIRSYCTRIQRGYQLIWDYFKHTPIAAPDRARRDSIEELVRRMVDAKGNGPHVEEWERELNALVYEVYGLTEEEIAIVERETTSDGGNRR